MGERPHRLFVGLDVAEDVVSESGLSIDVAGGGLGWHFDPSASESMTPGPKGYGSAASTPRAGPATTPSDCGPGSPDPGAPGAGAVVLDARVDSTLLRVRRAGAVCTCLGAPHARS